MGVNCAKCSTGKVIPLVGVMDLGQYSDGRLKAHVGYTNPEAWLFKGTVYARLSAIICGECGYAELTAENPGALLRGVPCHQVSDRRHLIRQIVTDAGVILIGLAVVTRRRFVSAGDVGLEPVHWYCNRLRSIARSVLDSKYEVRS
jgi:hypothetical protein